MRGMAAEIEAEIGSMIERGREEVIDLEAGIVDHPKAASISRGRGRNVEFTYPIFRLSIVGRS